jgi:glycosyltransferase involved in cell wall biosynthesis
VIKMIGSQVLLGIYGRLKKKPIDIKCPDNFKPSITVVIPCKNEAKRLPYALASLARQTYKIDKVVIIDDGSTDNTTEVIKLMRELLTNLNIEIMKTGEKSIGKTPAIKMATNRCTTEKMFVFDADTILEDDYIEKVVPPHFDKKVACSYGIVKPLTREYKIKFYSNILKALLLKPSKIREELPPEMVNKLSTKIISENDDGYSKPLGLKYYLHEWLIIKYREAVYADQYFTRNTQKRIFGTTLFPVGCGVLYDLKKLKTVFNKYEKSLGDNLTTSEDIFVGFEFCNMGLINYQVTDVYMWTVEPTLKRFPFQLILWNSSFIQSAYYFGKMSIRFKGDGDKKPMGLTILPPIFEKISYPIALLIMGFVAYKWALVTMMIEFITFFGIYYFVTPKKEREGLALSLVVSEPIRLLSVPIDFYILGKFCVDIVSGNRNWRK